MTYSAIYCSLIERRLCEPLPDNEYGEKHHIIPKSEGGTDDKENLVRLSAREHYVAHLLLAKMYDDVKMYSAVIYMRCGNKYLDRSYKFNSRLYQKMREGFSRKISASYSGRHYYNNGEKEVRTFTCPKGFVSGRMPYSEQSLKNMKIGSQSEKKKAAARANFQKASAMNRGKPFSEEHRRKISEATRGEKNGMYGKHLTSEERAKASRVMMGMKFWNNGKISIRARECPNGFVKGRLKKKGQ